MKMLMMLILWDLQAMSFLKLMENFLVTDEGIAWLEVDQANNKAIS